MIAALILLTKLKLVRAFCTFCFFQTKKLPVKWYCCLPEKALRIKIAIWEEEKCTATMLGKYVCDSTPLGNSLGTQQMPFPECYGSPVSTAQHEHCTSFPACVMES